MKCKPTLTCKYDLHIYRRNYPVYIGIKTYLLAGKRLNLIDDYTW